MREAALNLANRYPDVESDALRRKIAALHGITTEQVVLGCGSGEIQRMAVDAFVGPGGKLVAALPTFEVVANYARRAGGEVTAVRLSANHAHDLIAMLAHGAAGTGLVYICNPNNPTGSLTPRREIEAFVRNLPATTSVLIDEAYHHYVGESSDYGSFIDRPIDDSRVIVTRSFSKVHGLAGIRVGYAVAAPETARRLAANRLLENVNVVAARAAVAALDDVEHVRASARRNADDRQEFLNQANARMLRAIDSHTNFVMLNSERPAAEVAERLKKSGVLVAAPFPPFDTYIRVSLGTSADMLEFWRAWDALPDHKMSM